MFIRDFNGARRATFSSLTSPIKTPAEVQLFNQLLPQHTRGTKTNFDAMARAFNDEVVHSLNSPSPTQGGGLTPKTSRQLQKFDRLVAKEICSRGSMDMLLSLQGAVNNQPHPPPPSVQNVVDAVQHLMQTATVQKGRDQGPPATALASKAAYPSKAKENKGNRQGEGQKGCSQCSWRPGRDGTTLYQHRATCEAYQNKFGKRK